MLFYPWIRGPGRKKIQIRDEHPGSYILVLSISLLGRKHLFMRIRIRDFVSPVSGMEKIGSGIRDKHPGSTTLLTVLLLSISINRPFSYLNDGFFAYSQYWGRSFPHPPYFVGVADPHHVNTDPDPAFHFTADADPAPHQSDGNMWPLRPPGLHFEPSTAVFWAFKAPEFDLYADAQLIPM
jgi:hypothetical protein